MTVVRIAVKKTISEKIIINATNGQWLTFFYKCIILFFTSATLAQWEERSTSHERSGFNSGQSRHKLCFGD